MKDDLYHRTLLDLARKARDGGRLEVPSATVVLDNPLCGDRITLDLDLSDGRVTDVGHKVRGCLLCQAAAAVIDARAPGESPVDLRRVAEQMALAMSRDPSLLEGLWPELAAFAPVHAHKSRHECVLLPFQALVQALDQAEEG